MAPRPGYGVAITGSVTLNQILSQDTFSTVPPLDETTITLSAGLFYALHFGPVVSIRAGVDLLDDAYDSYFAKVGIAMPLF